MGHDWPTKNLLLGRSLFRHFGIPSPTRSLIAKYADQSVIDAAGMPSYDPDGNDGPGLASITPPACNAVAAERVRAMLDFGRAARKADALASRTAYERLRSAELVKFVEPLATHGYAFKGHGDAEPDSDELDEATGPPELAAAGLRWSGDPEHAQAVADVIARAHSNIDKLGLEAERTARLKQQSADIVNELKEAFLTKFYADDKPAKVEPWLKPLLDGAAAKSFKAHPRRYTKTMSKFMAEMEVELENANILEPAGNITDRFTAFAQAPAVVAPTKHKQGDPLRKQWRLAWDLRQANRLIRSYAWPAPTIAELEQPFGGARYYFSSDFVQSFYQLLHHRDSRDVCILLTDSKAWRSTRVLMGSRNSTAALGRATAVIFADLLRELAIYADDCAGGKAEPEDLLRLAKKFLQRCITASASTSTRRNSHSSATSSSGSIACCATARCSWTRATWPGSPPCRHRRTPAHSPRSSA